jgi:hypothetical protein
MEKNEEVATGPEQKPSENIIGGRKREDKGLT